MNRPLKTVIVLAAVAGLALAVVCAPAAAKKPTGKKNPCWKVLINDWYDGKIDGKYALRCYREALRHAKGDTYALGYTSLYDDINRAYQRRRAELAAQKHKKGKGGGDSTGQAGVPPGSSGNGGPNSPPTATQNPGSEGTHGQGGNQTGKQTQPGDPSTSPPGSEGSAKAGEPGRGDGNGPAQRLIAKLGPDDATSIPIPLIVLAGIAFLLMAAGAASLIARRAQSRRVPVPVRPVPPARGR